MLPTGKHLCWSLFLFLSIGKFLRAPTWKNICVWLLLKMCSWNWEKLKFIRSFNFTLKNQYQYSTSISETSENVCFYFMIGFPWSLYLHTIFLWCGEKETSNTKYLQLIKRRSKVQESSCERALNFDQWKTFSENYKPMELDYGLFTNYPRLSNLPTFLRVHSNSKEVSYLSWQNTCLNLKTTCHIKLKFFFWT